MLGKPIEIKLRVKYCYCHTCDKDFHHLGIMSHRSAHMRRNEICKITYKSGDTFWHFPTKEAKQEWERANSNCTVTPAAEEPPQTGAGE